MARPNMPSAIPLYVAAGLAIGAILTVWPEPLSGGWLMPSLVAGGAGILASLPFWRAAQASAVNDGTSGLGGLFTALLAGALVGVVMLHLANAVLPPGGAEEVVATVTDKYVTRGRRGRRQYHVVTTPVPGDSGSTDHSVGGLFASAGGYDDYQIGGCMAVRWRPGWWWPVVLRRQPAPCPATPPTTPKLPLAVPGTAWPMVEKALAVTVSGLALPAAGVRIELVADVAANGRITRLEPTADSDPRAFQAVVPVLMARPGTLAGGPARVRLWLKLLPG